MIAELSDKERSALAELMWTKTRDTLVIVEPGTHSGYARIVALRAHMQIKGAELPFEDEKFSYVALTHTPATSHPARVLAQPVVSKVDVTAKLCTPDGLALTKAADAYFFSPMVT